MLAEISCEKFWERSFRLHLPSRYFGYFAVSVAAQKVRNADLPAEQILRELARKSQELSCFRFWHNLCVAR